VLSVVERRELHLEVIFVHSSQNVKKKAYGSTEALFADVKWIVHNSIIYNGSMLFFSVLYFMGIKWPKHVGRSLQMHTWLLRVGW